jgi:hypothetical protein
VTSSASTPGNAASDDFYDVAPLEPHLVYQGEIFADVPILSMPKPKAWQLIRTKSGKRVHDALQHGGLGNLVMVHDSNFSKELWYEDGLGDYVMAVLDKRPAVVLTQTCDVQNKDHIQVAPIFSAKSDEKYIEKLKNREILSAVWIKTHPPEISEESYADLELVQAVHKTYFKRILASQHFRLTAERIRILQGAITRYFGRPNSFDSRVDTVPTNGTYLCVACFYMAARVTQVPLEKDLKFPVCETCRGTGWVLKGR